MINLNGNNLFFSDPSNPQAGYNHIAIGQAFPYAKFTVQNTTDWGAGYFNSKLNGTATNNYGVVAITTGGDNNFGIYSSASFGNNACAGFFTAISQGNTYGIKAAADSGQNSYGIFAKVTNNGQFNAAGYFSGDLVYTGSCYQASDAMLKQNVTPMTNAMSIINQLQPKTYTFKTNDYSYMNLTTGTNYGLIANDVETVLPNIVKTNIYPAESDSAGNIISPEVSYKGINYIELIPIMLQGMKEQQTAIDSLKRLVAALQVHPLPGNKSMGGQNNNGNDPQNNYQVVELSTENLIILNQNDPNPFAEETDITYFLPDNVNSAKIMFYDNTGRIIKAVELNGTGNGTLHVYASNLSSGIYAYTLIVDGKAVDTKKMVCTKK